MLFLGLLASAAAGEFHWDPVADTALTASTLVTTLVWDGITKDLPSDPGPYGQAPTGIDAWAIHAPNDTADRASDLLLLASMPLALGASWLGDDRKLVAPLLVVEATSLTSVLTDGIKFAVNRPRPFLFAGSQANSRDATLSFPSGHTSLTGALTFSAAATLDQTTKASPWLLYGSATAITASVGALRVVAGKHYPSDVLVGAALGAGTGLMVPALHRSSVVVSVGDGPTLRVASNW